MQERATNSPQFPMGSDVPEAGNGGFDLQGESDPRTIGAEVDAFEIGQINNSGQIAIIQEAPNFQETTPQKGNRRFVTRILPAAAVISAVAIACGGHNDDVNIRVPEDTPTPVIGVSFSNTPAVENTLTPTITTPPETPTHEPGIGGAEPRLSDDYTRNEDGSWNYKNEDGTIIRVPTIEGFRLAPKEVEGEEYGRLVYYAKDGNSLGIEKDKVVGSFNPNITFEGIGKGSLSLSPEVVNAIESDSNENLRFALPIAFNSKGNVSLSIVRDAIPNVNVTVLKISPENGKLVVSNAMPGQHEIAVYGNNIFGNSLRLRNLDAQDMSVPMMNRFMITGRITSHPISTYFVAEYGENLVEFEGNAFVFFSLVKPTDHPTLSPDNIITYGGLPVAVSNQDQELDLVVSQNQ